MKKQNQTDDKKKSPADLPAGKLRVEKSTVKELSDAELDNVAGGVRGGVIGTVNTETVVELTVAHGMCRNRG